MILKTVIFLYFGIYGGLSNATQQPLISRILDSRIHNYTENLTTEISPKQVLHINSPSNLSEKVANYQSIPTQLPPKRKTTRPTELSPKQEQKNKKESTTEIVTHKSSPFTLSNNASYQTVTTVKTTLPLTTTTLLPVETTLFETTTPISSSTSTTETQTGHTTELSLKEELEDFEEKDNKEETTEISALEYSPFIISNKGSFQPVANVKATLPSATTTLLPVETTLFETAPMSTSTIPPAERKYLLTKFPIFPNGPKRNIKDDKARSFAEKNDFSTMVLLVILLVIIFILIVYVIYTQCVDS